MAVKGSAQEQVSGKDVLRHSNELAMPVRCGSDLPRPLQHAPSLGLTDVEDLAFNSALDDEAHSGGHIADVSPRPQERTRTDGYRVSVGTTAPKDELLSASLVTWTVDHRQTQDGGRSLAVLLLDVELFVIVERVRRVAVHVSLIPEWRSLINGNRIVGRLPSECARSAVDVHARQ